MQGGQGPGREPGRGVYVVRRIVAALVILLVLALLIPQAWKALRGPGDTGSGTQDTADVESSGGGDEESDTTEETVGGTEDVVQQEDVVEDRITSSGAESSEDVSTAENIEIAAGPAETDEVLVEVPVSE